jgi:hypothetical protein
VRVSRIAVFACRATSIVTIAGAVGFVLYWAAVTLLARPTMAGETEVLFEASRIRARLPLYLDPIAGAHEYGPLPARYLVTYPPLWSWVVSHVPPGPGALVFARVASTCAWCGALALLAVRARPRCRSHAILAAAFFAGTFNLALFADSGRPDSIAILFATIALSRAIRLGRTDAVSGALLALAALTKPTVVGLAVGVFAAEIASPRRARAAIGGALAVGACAVSILESVSHHTWFRHVVQSNLQPISVAAWLDAMRHDTFFFVGPAAYSLAIGWRHRRDAGIGIGLAALAGALAWALFSRAKTGSSTNYWMESSIGIVALCAQIRPPVSAGGPIVAGLALTQALWVGIASMKSAAYRAAADLRIDALVGSARSLCDARPDDFVMSDDPGAELRANGRIYTTGYQMTFLTLSGHYPASLWAHEIERPDVTCFVEHTGVMRLVPELAQTLDAKFRPVASTDDWTVLRLR